MTAQVTGKVPAGLADRVRCWLAAPVALLASSLAVVCVVSVVDVLPDLEQLAVANVRFAGWAGVGVLVAVVASIVGLLSQRRAGPGPVLSLGAAAAVFGLALGNEIVDDVQVALALVMSGMAVGGLLTGTAGMAFELVGRWRAAVLVAWSMPLVCGWPLLTWIALHQPTGDDPRITLHPSVWLLAPVSAVIVAWSVLSMLVTSEGVARRSRESWEGAWLALVTTLGVAALVVMVLGFESGVDRAWLRPLVIAVTAVFVLALAGVAVTISVPAARTAYVAVMVPLLSLPACTQLLILVADAGNARVDAPIVAVVGGSGVVGTVVGFWRPRHAAWAGLLVMAGASAGGWVMPDGPWLMAASAAPLVGGAGLAVGAGVRTAAVSQTALRFVTVSVVGVVMIATTLSIPLGWSLGGAVASSTDDARAAGRVILGLTFALSVIAAAYVGTWTPTRTRHSGTPGRPVRVS